MAVDAIDRDILALLAQDGRMSVRAIAEEIGLGPSATTDRIRRMEADGVITGYGVRVDPAAIGQTIDAVVDVQLPQTGPLSIDDELMAIPQVVDAVHLTGQFDYQLRVSCRGVDELEAVIWKLKGDLGVQQTGTRIVLRSLDGMPRPPEPLLG